MPAMTMTNKVYRALEQAAHMTGAAKIPSWRIRSAVTLSNCRKMRLVLIRSDSEDLVFLSRPTKTAKAAFQSFLFIPKLLFTAVLLMQNCKRTEDQTISAKPFFTVRRGRQTKTALQNSITLSAGRYFLAVIVTPRRTCLP